MVQWGPAVPGEPALLTVGPFINHRYTSPELCRQRMSALASALKPPTPWMDQSVETLPGDPVPTVLRPSISQMWRADRAIAVAEPDGNEIVRGRRDDVELAVVVQVGDLDQGRRDVRCEADL